ncbi:MAG: extracellular solute-binding protein [Planctomycetota bacterium]
MPDKPPASSPSAGSGWRPLDTLSPGSWIIVGIAAVSSVLVFALPVPQRDGLEFWTFTRNHIETYRPVVEQWNAAAAEGTAAAAGGVLQPVNLFSLDGVALERRTLNGIWSGTPLADLIEIEGSTFYKYVSGPIEDVGFIDLTERLHNEGIYDAINPPSFSPWTSRGRVFGIPHDVHPVLLAYRADIVEDELGVDVTQIETWDDFARLLAPAIRDLDGDGRADRYLLNFWYNDADALEVLMLQAGGGTFDADDHLIVDSEVNARVLSTGLSWCFGPGRLAIHAPDFDAGGNQLKLDGRVVAALMPDWLAGVWKQDLPQLGGKLKLMPLPAWEPGGRRTSVRGGTMLAVPRATQDAGRFDAAWAFAKELYLSPRVAETLFRQSSIISPVIEFWDQPFYREPDPYFSGQPSGTLYIEQAPHVPRRPSHPFRIIARTEIGRAAESLRQYADRTNTYDADALMPEARRLLAAAAQRVEQQMQRNAFLDFDDTPELTPEDTP